jgi:putative DNA primase/helicase
MMNTIERARHRWREILPRLGIETKYLSNRHGPCPLCGGKDRFRFDDRDGDGTYYCNQCGAGVGLLLIRKRNGWDFRTACDEIDKIIGTGPAPSISATPQGGPNRRRADAIHRALAQAVDADIVDAYLDRRGITARSGVLRGHARCPYFDDRKQFVWTFPAVVAPIVGPDGTVQSLHRIYDADIEPRKKSLPPVTTIAGGAVRLFEPDEELGVAEGIETALAAYEAFKVPVWAALTANGIKGFVPPHGLLRLHVFADNDSNYVGQAAAYDLAHRLNRDGLTVEVRVPEPIKPDKTDWLDVLNTGRRP